MQSIPIYILAVLISMCLFGCGGRHTAPEDISPPTAVSDEEEGTPVTVDTKIADVMADPAKADTGLFFFKGEEDAPFAICNAGGGFAYVGAMHDSFPCALELSKKGYNAFALIYRPGAQTACEDLARAISFVFANGSELGVSTDCYSLWGGSAGARMAAYLDSLGPAAFGGDDLPLGVVVTVAGTGSECNGGAVITNEALKVKTGRDYPKCNSRFAARVWGIPNQGKGEKALARAGVEALADFIKELGLPSTLRELGVTEDIPLEEIADSVPLTPGGYGELTHKDMLKIFKACL